MTVESDLTYDEAVELLERVGRKVNDNPDLRMHRLKGMPGEFYHGSLKERRRDLKRICHRIIAEKLDAEVERERVAAAEDPHPG